MNCQHTQTRTEVYPYGTSEHYARVVCAECGAHLCFQSHPHVLAKRQLNAARIQKLVSMHKQLTPYEKGFLAGVRNHKPTPAQQQVLDGLVKKYIQEGVTVNENSKTSAVSRT